MGMTIDEAIRRIDEHNYIHQSKEPRAVHITEAFNTLIEAAKKYQKIEQIYLKWNRNYDIQTSSAWTEVMEVLEDGQNITKD